MKLHSMNTDTAGAQCQRVPVVCLIANGSGTGRTFKKHTAGLWRDDMCLWSRSTERVNRAHNTKSPRCSRGYHGNSLLVSRCMATKGATGPIGLWQECTETWPIRKRLMVSKAGI